MQTVITKRINHKCKTDSCCTPTRVINATPALQKTVENLVTRVDELDSAIDQSPTPLTFQNYLKSLPGWSPTSVLLGNFTWIEQTASPDTPEGFPYTIEITL